MGYKHYFKYFTLLIGVLFLYDGSAQELDTIHFDRKKNSKPQGLFSRNYDQDNFYGCDFKKEGIEFTLVLHESQSGLKQLLIAPYGQDSVFVGKNIGCAPLKMIEGFQVGNRLFEIVSIDYTERIAIIQNSLTVKPAIILHDESMPPVDFLDVDSSKQSFRNYLNQDKYVYVDFWGLWCPQCLKEIPELKEIYASHKERLTIIALNRGDQRKEILDFTLRESINWINGYSTEILERWFFVEGFPHGVLFDSNGSLVKLNCTTSDLNDIIEADGF